MATAPATIAFLLEQTAAAKGSARKMFGEYGFYAAGTFVGVVCADALYLKPTPAGRLLAPDAPLAPPYPGARPHLQIDPDQWDDAQSLCALLRATAEAQPASGRKPGRKA